MSLPLEDWETEKKPKRSAPSQNASPQSKPQKKQWGFWEVFLLTLGIPYVLFMLLALIGSFLK